MSKYYLKLFQRLFKKPMCKYILPISKYSLVLYFFFVSKSLVYAQEYEKAPLDLSKIILPKLEVLYENARKSPGVGMYEAKIEAQDHLLTTERRSWLKYFKIGGSYQYGNIAMNSAFTNEFTPLYYQSMGQIQNTWFGSAGVSIPLDDLFDRKNKIKRQQTERRFTELERERWFDEQCIRITESFMRVKYSISILQKIMEEFNISSTNFKLIETEFKIGNAKLSDLNNAKKQEAEAYDRMKTNEFDLYNEVLKLEILSKTKIISH